MKPTRLTGKTNALLMSCSRAALDRAEVEASRARRSREEMERAYAQHEQVPQQWPRQDSAAPCPASDWEARLVDWHEQRIELQQQRERAEQSCRHHEFIANRARAKHLQMERHLASSSGVRRGE